MKREIYLKLVPGGNPSPHIQEATANGYQFLGGFEIFVETGDTNTDVERKIDRQIVQTGVSAKFGRMTPEEHRDFVMEVIPDFFFLDRRSARLFDSSMRESTHFGFLILGKLPDKQTIDEGDQFESESDSQP
jgi:hypothetical protein